MATNIIHLTCQHCGAALDLDTENLIAYCPHCGQKLLFDVDQIGNILLEKEKTKQQEMKYQHDFELKKMKNEDDWKQVRLSIFFLIGFFCFVIVVSILYSLYGK